MRRWASSLLIFFFAVIKEADASLPPPYPENDWQTLSTLLADKSISPNWRTPDGRSIVLLHLQYGAEAKAVELLKGAKRAKVWYEGKAERLMLLAAMWNAQQIVKTLLAFGETPNSLSVQDESPLMLAASHGNLEIMRMLIHAGADVNYKAAYGKAAVHSALRGGQDMAIHILIDAGLRLESYKANEFAYSLVFQAIEGGSSHALFLLIEKNFDVSSRRENGDTPLTFAIWNLVKIGTIEQLLAAGADPCITNADGVLPEQLVASDEKYKERFGSMLKDECEISKLRTLQGIQYPAVPRQD